MGTAYIVKVVAVAAVAALASWGLTRLVSSLASEEEEDRKTNEREDSPQEYYSADGKTNEREESFNSHQIPINELEDSHYHHHHHQDEAETDEEGPYGRPLIELQDLRRDHHGKEICWRFPGSGKLKMNTDGSVKWRSNEKDGSVRYIKPPRAGFGGVIRDERGCLIVGFYGRILKDGCEILEAELWAIYKGLEIIRGQNLRGVEIESDSQAAVHLIEDETAYLKSHFRELVEKCKATKQETGCTLAHALRERNRVADILAKRGRDQHDDFITFTNPSSFKMIKNFLRADVAAANRLLADPSS